MASAGAPCGTRVHAMRRPQACSGASREFFERGCAGRRSEYRNLGHTGRFKPKTRTCIFPADRQALSCGLGTWRKVLATILRSTSFDMPSSAATARA